MNYRDNKGAITLYVVVAMVAFLLFAIATYVFISRRNQTQYQVTSEIKNVYDKANNEEIYDKYFENGYVPIYTAEDFRKIGTNEKVSISKENGKIFTFSADATYMLMNDIDLNQDKYSVNPETMVITFAEGAVEWTPITIEGENGFTGVIEGNGHTIKGIYINKESDNEVRFNKKCNWCNNP